MSHDPLLRYKHSEPAPPPRSTTGVDGLDQILDGGLPRDEMYLIQGVPGTGKTTFGLQFLLEGVRQSEPVLYITLSQTRRGLEKIAETHGWSLDAVHIHELAAAVPSEEVTESEKLPFYSGEVELRETTNAFFDAVNRIGPSRVVFDSMAEIRLLASQSLNYRQEIIMLRRFFADRFCTVLLLDTKKTHEGDADLAAMVHGIIDLDQKTPEYGEVRRGIRVMKMRGMPFLGGYHNFRIRTGGIEVYPRLSPVRSYDRSGRHVISSGIPELDELLGGGLMEGTACLLMGPSGTGKTSLSLKFVHRMAQQGNRGAVFLFDEHPETFFTRAKGLGMDLETLARREMIGVHQINTGEFSPSEFAQTVRNEVDENGARVVVIDSLTGYVNAMLGESHLIGQMHELLTYLSQQGVLGLLVVAQQGPLGEDIKDPVDVSYMADALLHFRHFEHRGELRQAIFVVKNRHGSHERAARELILSNEGIRVGPPLKDEHDVSFDFGAQHVGQTHD